MTYDEQTKKLKHMNFLCGLFQRKLMALKQEISILRKRRNFYKKQSKRYRTALNKIADLNSDAEEFIGIDESELDRVYEEIATTALKINS